MEIVQCVIETYGTYNFKAKLHDKRNRRVSIKKMRKASELSGKVRIFNGRVQNLSTRMKAAKIKLLMNLL